MFIISIMFYLDLICFFFFKQSCYRQEWRLEITANVYRPVCPGILPNLCIRTSVLLTILFAIKHFRMNGEFIVFPQSTFSATQLPVF